MKIMTIQVPNSTNDFDSVVNDTEDRLSKSGTPVKFTQTHITVLPEDGEILYTAILFYNA